MILSYRLDELLISAKIAYLSGFSSSQPSDNDRNSN